MRLAYVGRDLSGGQLMNRRRVSLASFFLVIFLSAGASAQMLQLEKAMTSTAGGESSGGSLTIETTVGQPFAGGSLTSTQYSAYIGFWAPEFAPTAAGVSVGGRAITAAGRPISQAVITLNNSAGEVWAAKSSPFGYYQLDSVPAGETYIITISSKTFTFVDPTRIVVVHDQVTDLDFISIEP